MRFIGKGNSSGTRVLVSWEQQHTACSDAGQVPPDGDRGEIAQAQRPRCQHGNHQPVAVPRGPA